VERCACSLLRKCLGDANCEHLLSEGDNAALCRPPGFVVDDVALCRARVDLAHMAAAVAAALV